MVGIAHHTLQEHPVLAIALRLEVWGYTNEVRLRGLIETRVGGFSLCSRDFQSPGVSSKSGCSHTLLT
jgi:hypothetical protein